jgi:hypothetical protein
MGEETRSENWPDRVRTYLHDLETVAREIDGCLKRLEFSQPSSSPEEIRSFAGDMQTAVGELQKMVARRETLLVDASAPGEGTNLTDKLRRASDPETRSLADQSGRLARNLSSVHERIVAFFVCQFHLAGLTRDLLVIMTGGQPAGTYRSRRGGGNARSGSVVPRDAPETGRGGLFNEAA